MSMQPTNENVAEDIEIICPNCSGDGHMEEETASGNPDFDRTYGPGSHPVVCPCCDGSGVVTAYHAMFCTECTLTGDAVVWESINEAISDAAIKARDEEAKRQYELFPALPLEAAA